jgi:hypothetical protein
VVLKYVRNVILTKQIKKTFGLMGAWSGGIASAFGVMGRDRIPPGYVQLHKVVNFVTEKRKKKKTYFC